MRTFAIINNKGGVGKTTTAINLAVCLATTYQQRVLLVDADGQRNATRALLGHVDEAGLAAILTGTVMYYDEVICPTDIDGLDMIPASSELWSIDLHSRNGGTVYINALRDVRDAIMEDDSYDVMVVDCPPHFSISCIAAILASNSIIIPVLPDAYSAEGMGDLVEQIDNVREIAPEIRVSGCLINQYHNSDVVLDAVEYFRESAPVPVYSTMIRRTDKVTESTWATGSVLIWSPQSAAARDYRAWVQELVAKEALCSGR